MGFPHLRELALPLVGLSDTQARKNRYGYSVNLDNVGAMLVRGIPGDSELVAYKRALLTRSFFKSRFYSSYEIADCRRSVRLARVIAERFLVSENPQY
jgi:hypothetical protein